jgi:hypothetical protein
MAHYDITTIPSLKCAIKNARRIRVQPKFGTNEKWIRISKVEALELIEGYADDATPTWHEMYGGIFGTMINGVLYMG